MFFPEIRVDNQIYSSALEILKDHEYTEKNFRAEKIFNCNGAAVFERFDICHPLGPLKVKAYFKKVNGGFTLERYDIRPTFTTAFYEGYSINSFKEELKDALEKEDIVDWRK
jgi:hypothetical protein